MCSALLVFFVSRVSIAIYFWFYSLILAFKLNHKIKYSMESSIYSFLTLFSEYLSKGKNY